MSAPAVIIPDFHAAAERHVRQPSLPLPTPGEAFDAAASELRGKLSRPDQIAAFDRVIDAAHRLSSEQYRRGLGEGR